MPDFIALIRARLEAEGAGRSATPMRWTRSRIISRDLHRSALRQGRSAAPPRPPKRALRSMTPLADRPMRSRRRGAALRRPTESGAAGIVVPAICARPCAPFRARPGYTALVVSTLALGLGACTAVFSLLNAMLLSPLPYPDPDRLALVGNRTPTIRRRIHRRRAQLPGLGREARSYDALGMWEYLTFNVSGDAEPRRFPGSARPASLFRVLGVPAADGPRVQRRGRGAGPPRRGRLRRRVARRISGPAVRDRSSRFA